MANFYVEKVSNVWCYDKERELGRILGTYSQENKITQDELVRKIVKEYGEKGWTHKAKEYFDNLDGRDKENICATISILGLTGFFGVFLWLVAKK